MDCKLQQKKLNFWEVEKKELSNLPNECLPQVDKVSFNMKEHGFFGWVKSIFSKR